jgi:hypothetical protein
MRIAVSRAPGAEGVVSPLELFFDLLDVFAIGGALAPPARARRCADGRRDGDHGARGARLVRDCVRGRTGSSRTAGRCGFCSSG